MTAPGWAAQLANVDPASVTSRAALAKLPLLRKSDLGALQKQNPPFGGFNATPVNTMRRLQMSPGPIFEPEGHAKDFWGAARASVRRRTSRRRYRAQCVHLSPHARRLHHGIGLDAIGCTVIPGGIGNTEQQLEAIAQFQPTGYTGTPDFLKILLDAAEKSGRTTAFRRGLVSGAALPASLRQEFDARGVAVLQCYATADVGVIAYESHAREGMIVNETMLVEIVRPGTGDPVADGDVGEVVVTAFNADYPMIRLAIGDLSAVMSEPSPCGRTNMRIRGWLGRADQTTKIKGMFVHPAQIAELARRHPELGRARLTVRRDGEQDAMTLQAECTTNDPALAQSIAASLQAVTKLRGEVSLVAPGSLPNDGKVIVDERSNS